MTAVDVEETLERYIGLWNERRRDEWLACLDDRVSHEEPVGAPVRIGREPFAEMFDLVSERFDEWPVIEIQDLIACGHECAVRFTSTGVRRGETVSTTVIEIWHVSEQGKLDGVRVFVVPSLGLL